MAYLVTVEGQRIPLRRGHVYTLGRGQKCDVLLEDRASSRVHARLSVDLGGRVSLEDLHSRNGTYLDGDRVVGSRLVPEGGRIKLGSTIFLTRLREGEDEEERFAETGTMGFDEPPRPDAEAGELHYTGLIELLTRLLIDRRDVSLRFALKDGEAKVEVRGGEVQAASHGGLSGFNALVRIGRQPNGIFWLTEDSTAVARTIGERPERLLSLLARCLDPVASR